MSLFIPQQVRPESIVKTVPEQFFGGASRGFNQSHFA
jgi:hypothetical protein